MKTFLKNLFTNPYIIMMIILLLLSFTLVIIHDNNISILRREIVIQVMMKDLNDFYADLNADVYANKNRTTIYLSSSKFNTNSYAKITAVYQPVLKIVGVKKIVFFKTVENDGKVVNISEIEYDVQKDKFNILII